MNTSKKTIAMLVGNEVSETVFKARIIKISGTALAGLAYLLAGFIFER